MSLNDNVGSFNQKKSEHGSLKHFVGAYEAKSDQAFDYFNLERPAAGAANEIFGTMRR